MDPPLISDSTFSSANPSLSEIWPLPHFPHTNSPPSFLPSSHSTLTHLAPAHANKRKHPPSDHDNSHSSKLLSAATPNHLNGSANKLVKLRESLDENGDSKAKAEASSAASNKLPVQSANPSDPPPKQDYIHVRARRGQATDSHSLAERARREKISERMKILQDLVPGCNKVIGKALVLDEIINYIQSLQRQVEFLSMKLEAVNSRLNMNPTIECFPTKDVGSQPFDFTGVILASQAARGFAQGSQPGWLHMQIGGGFERAT